MNTRNYNKHTGSNLRSPENHQHNNGSISGTAAAAGDHRNSFTPRRRFNTNNRTIDPQVFRDTQSKGLSSRIVSYHDKNRQYTKPIINRAYNRVGELPIVNFNKNQIPHRKNPLLNSSLLPQSRLEIAAPDKTNYQSRLEILRTGVMSSSQSDHHRLIDLACENTLVSGGNNNNNNNNNNSHHNNSNHIENESLAPLDALKEISRKRIHSNHIVSDLIKKQRAEQQQQHQKQHLFNVDESSINSRFDHNNCTSSFSSNYPVESINNASATSPAAISTSGISNKRNRDQSSPKTPPEQLQKKRTCNNDVLSSLSSSLFLNKPKRKLDESISYEGNQSKIRQHEVVGMNRSDSLVDQTILNENQNQDEREKFFKEKSSKIEQRNVDKNVSTSFVGECVDGVNQIEKNIVENMREKQTHPKLTLFNKSYTKSSSTIKKLPTNQNNDDGNEKKNTNDEDSDDEDDNQENQFTFVKPKLSTLADDNVFIKKPMEKSKLALMLSCLSGEIDNNDTDEDFDIVDKGEKKSINLLPTNKSDNVINLITTPAKDSLLSSISPLTTTSVVESDKNINNKVYDNKTLPTTSNIPVKEIITNKTITPESFNSNINNTTESSSQLLPTTLSTNNTTLTTTTKSFSPQPVVNFSMPATLSTQIPTLTSKPILSGINFDTMTKKSNETATIQPIGFNTAIISPSSTSTTLPTQKQVISSISNTITGPTNVNTGGGGGGFSFNPVSTNPQSSSAIPQQTTHTIKPAFNFGSNNQSQSSVNKSLFQNLPTLTPQQQNSPTNLDKTITILPTSVNSAFNKPAFNNNLPTTTATEIGGFMSQQNSQSSFGIGMGNSTADSVTMNPNKSFSLLSSPLTTNPSKQSPINNTTFKFGGGNDSNSSFSFLSSVDNDKKAAPLLSTPSLQQQSNPIQGKSNQETVTAQPFSFGGSSSIKPTTSTIPTASTTGQLQGNGRTTFGFGTNTENQSTTSSPFSFGASLNQENKSQTTLASPQLPSFGTSITNSGNTFQFGGGGSTGGGVGATPVTKSITEPVKSTNNTFMFGGGGGGGNNNITNTATSNPVNNSSNNLFSFGDSASQMSKNADTTKPMGGNSTFTFGGGSGSSNVPSFGGNSAFGGKVSTSSFTFNAPTNNTASPAQQQPQSTASNPIFNFGGNTENKQTTQAANITGQQQTVQKSMFTLPTNMGTSSGTTTETPTNLFSFGSSSSGPSSSSLSTIPSQQQGQFNFSAGNVTNQADQSGQLNLFSPGPSSMPLNAKGRIIRQATRKLNK